MTKVSRTKPEQAKRARRELLRAAFDIISRGGLAQLTLANVGIHAGYSRGLAQYHFGSRENLITALVDDVFDAHDAMLVADTGEGSAMITVMTDFFCELARNDPVSLRGYWALSAEMSLYDNENYMTRHGAFMETAKANISRHFIASGVTQELAGTLSMLILATMRGLIELWAMGNDNDNFISHMNALKNLATGTIQGEALNDRMAGSDALP